MGYFEVSDALSTSSLRIANSYFLFWFCFWVEIICFDVLFAADRSIWVLFTAGDLAVVLRRSIFC